MKIRIKFSKTGIMKFIGHLDVMRYFQKVNRRAGVDIAYSGGFSPHQIMSFASPLGLGLTSEGEYLDIEMNGTEDSRTMRDRMNHEMVEGMEILSYRRLPDTAKPAMSIVAAADYMVSSKEGYEEILWDGWKAFFASFCSQESILIWKKTKKCEKQVDIRPMIYEWRVEASGIFLRLAAGSADNLKPELLLEALFQYAGREFCPHAFSIHRLEIYADTGTEKEHSFIPLEEMGEEILIPVPRTEEDKP
ncbi:TIGR03936 family radical SAM-associated protein [Lacrimispora sp. NSJ-141]|uniref:TIGR03936 family radical SAM-associated protein n=1 Tax=Lientehia hominis TaxID=2897778 RepID=A0AAP2W695_9FIRM|nr:TIGR03936 family radical SAM-associated protein [Lientehia hominis]MCD2491083.1 TIGR03936 family radical SAM-associated protein [Lientehia hominis]